MLISKVLNLIGEFYGIFGGESLNFGNRREENN